MGFLSVIIQVKNMSGKFRPLVRDDSQYFRIFDDSNSDDDERDTDLETLLGKQSPSKWKWYDFFC